MKTFKNGYDRPERLPETKQLSQRILLYFLFIFRLLHNGACVKLANCKKPLTDYHDMPPEKEKIYVKEILADHSKINYVGFPHLQGCTKIKKIQLKNCDCIEDNALKYLCFIKDSLRHLEIVNCKNITDEGLRHLKDLKLKTLVVKNLPSVYEIDEVKKELEESLKGCNIKIEK